MQEWCSKDLLILREATEKYFECLSVAMWAESKELVDTDGSD
jgi:hypothetical protein